MSELTVALITFSSVLFYIFMIGIALKNFLGKDELNDDTSSLVLFATFWPISLPLFSGYKLVEHFQKRNSKNA